MGITEAILKSIGKKESLTTEVLVDRALAMVTTTTSNPRKMARKMVRTLATQGALFREFSYRDSCMVTVFTRGAAFKRFIRKYLTADEQRELMR